MSLSNGMQLGFYKIIAPIGAGGMGEVYRARDSRLDRDVAIKVLPASFANDPERLTRFAQEARATSALNHPNILTIYEFGEYDGCPYIVTELLQGEELREYLNNGALPQRRAVDYAQQISSGLASAHFKSIIHRDLKPENIFVTTDGRVKILDFGLAKLRPQPSEPTGSGVATRKAITDPGVVIGTVGYMSPEQVRGLEADHRADIFSFGAILYEMLSGRRAFTGESSIEVMNAILKEEPPELSETNQKLSPSLEKIVRRCLEKKAERRFQSTSDLCFAIEALSTPSGARLGPAVALPAVETISSVSRSWRRNKWWIAATALAVLAAAGFARAYFSRKPVEGLATVRFTITAPEGVNDLLSPMISPDGRNVVFAAVIGDNRGHWLRPLDSVASQLIPGSSSQNGPHFWSPDSRSFSFPTIDGKLKRIDLIGGPPQTLCTLPSSPVGDIAFGGTWSRDGTILFSFNGTIYRLQSAGGDPTPVFKPDQVRQEVAYRAPSFLPDGRHFLYLAVTGQQDDSGIYLASLDGGAPRRLFTAASQASYTTTPVGEGFLLFVRDGALLAQPFNPASLELGGKPLNVADSVRVSTTGRAIFSVSDNGVLVYDPAANEGSQQLTWFDRAGKQLEAVSPEGVYEAPRLSPDSKRVAVARTESRTSLGDIYVTDLKRGTTSRLTFDPADDRRPVWSPDGTRIAWGANREGKYQIYQKLATGVGQDELLLESNNRVLPDDWSPNGKFIVYIETDPKTHNDVWVLPLDGDRKPFPFLQTPAEEVRARFSTEGRLLGYLSNESGIYETYIQTFPASGGKWQVSISGGSTPAWRADGKELYYGSGGKMWAVEVKSGSPFEPSVPRALFDLPRNPSRSGWAVTADAQRFLFVTNTRQAPSLQYTVVVNWAAEVKR